ncbi:probable ATP-dependent RNA helicase dbp9 [Cephalotrichum gorgonifer]|uniref:RNA helicase n=1 Tax=Cephalotrichum gorgonifer TaxID=2041049 RepID=A0AAE8MRJ1_9PEZI|nr:probable ATP-dependent RNA helicase dbp9 [Cephalotrichum gorgonifer]
MKRKLNTNDEPVAEEPATKSTEPKTSFSDLGLDPRLIQAIAQEKYREPTLVQCKAIPLALEGKDVLAKAKTGSGKTAAYILPVLQAILKRKQSNSSPFTSALILVPTRELADQVHKVIESLTAFCAKDIQAIKLSDKVSDAVQRSLLSNSPDIVVSTPSRAWTNINSSALSLEKLSHIVLDEADLVLSYGYEEDLNNVAKKLPKGVQTILMSATLTTEVDTLKGIFARNPVVLNLEEKDAEGEGVSQYVVKCSEEEKFLLIYVIYKLKLIKGKSIIFVADVDRCYRLKLYFEQFGLRSCILNSELPVNSRLHVVEEFNKGVYDIIIASDENEVIPDEETPKESAEGGEADGEKAAEAPKKKKQKTSRRDKEYGVSRGIDFKNVACVVNFDLPTSAKSYTHRIGRTGRAGQRGMALSFVIPTDQYRKHPPTWVESTEHDEKVLARIIKQQAKVDKVVEPYNFDMEQVDAFRYRMNDALRAVTKVAVREARTRELREELLKSEKLKRHFEENPSEMHHLRHDGELRAARTQAHLKHVPDYLLPEDARKTGQGIGFVPFNKPTDKKDRRQKKFRAGKRKSNPLKSFKARPKTNKKK